MPPEIDVAKEHRLYEKDTALQAKEVEKHGKITEIMWSWKTKSFTVHHADGFERKARDHEDLAHMDHGSAIAYSVGHPEEWTKIHY